MKIYTQYSILLLLYMLSEKLDDSKMPVFINLKECWKMAVQDDGANNHARCMRSLTVLLFEITKDKREVTPFC